MNIVDTEGTNDSTETVTDTQNLDSDVSGDTDTSPEIQETKNDPSAPYVPFSGGKEKFKVNGKEYEWDWETTRRYAQLGRSGQAAMERAAQVEKKAKEAHQQLLRAAQEDPEGLLEILNPRYRRVSQARPQQIEDTEEADPRDREIQTLKAQVEQFSGYLEKQQIDEERNAIQSELEDAATKFPILKNEIYQDYVKNQYRRYLMQGITDISIEDIAFHVHQKVQEENQSQMQRKKAALETKRKNAPVSSVPGSSGLSDRLPGESGIEYAKRLAGRQ